VDGVPQGIDPRDLVGDELHHIEHQRRSDDPVVVEDAELFRQRDPPESLREAEDRHSRVQIDSGGEREAHRPPEHRECLDHVASLR